jgi:hypothetical protein
VEPVFLKLPINNAPSDDLLSDLNAPFSFLEWKQRRPNFIEKQATLQYNSYVLDWFETNKTKNTAKTFLLKQKYLYLLDQLQLFFSEKEKHEWFNKINLMDEKELLLSIPYFARKLKHVALYYLNLRKELKNAKLKYNTVGTAFGIEQDLYNAMLKTFSTLNDELLPEVKSVVPELSTIRESLVIQIEELYDDKDYFDVSPALPVTSRFNLFHDATASFYQTKGINLSAEEWMLNCLSLSADLDFNTFVDRITGTILETTDTDLYADYVSKYLSENKFSLETNMLSSQYEITETLINQGNNYFYYPKGITDPTILFEKKITNVSLSSLNLEGATAGTTLETSDTVFIKNGKDIKGAWLRYKEHEDSSELVEAKLEQYDSTTFIFPYPGYGLSSEGIFWTGPSFVTTPEYNFLANTLRAAINTAYWSYEFDSNSMVSIPINESTLIAQGAVPDTNPNFADRISIRSHDPLNLNTPALVLSGSWLYKFERSLFAISPTSENKFLWPFCLINSTDEYPAQFNEFDFSAVCEPVNIADIDSKYSIGSNSFSTSDKIYKFSKYSDGIELATECCWLSSDIENLSFHKSFKQNGFNGLFKSGIVEKFIWNGPDNTPLDNVFTAISHKPECPFVTNTPAVSSLEWEKCSCKQVYYSPFGHPGNFFEDNNGFADFIARDYSNGVREFDIDSWRDITGSPFKGSLNVAWYKTNSSKPDWGNGQWVNNNNPISNTPFLLKKGQSYYYNRAQIKTANSTLPPYSVSYAYSLANRGKWIGAKLNEDGEWVSTNLVSNVILYPGDIVKYERASQTTQYLISSELVEDTSKNIRNAWSTFDYIVSGTPQSTVYLSWPMDPAPIGSSLAAQYPPFGLLDIKELYWWKIQHTAFPSISTLIESPFTMGQATSAVNSTTFVTVTANVYNNKTIVAFTPPITGTYTVTVSAKSVNGVGYLATNIPPLTVVPQYFSQELLVNQGTAANGFLLEQPLYGWDYLNKKAGLGATGAKPYWAQLYVGKETENRFKGAFSWGYPNNFIDGYIPNHSPLLSKIKLEYGQTVTYDRVGTVLNWIQPITFKTYSGTSHWCTLSVSSTEASNLSSIYVSKQLQDINVQPLLTPTDIQLTNILNGLPVEVYYCALNSFTWKISTETIQPISDSTQTLQLEAQAPWANLNNRFFSSVATIPLLDEVYSETNVGGYFIPQNLGASLAINKDFEAYLDTVSLSENILVEDTNIHIGGRGRTRQDQYTPYSWKEQNQWMKEPPTAGKLAGSVKRNLTKTLQTFVPYEEGSAETFLGLVTPSSRVSPWEGTFGNVWTDTKNEPKSLTEVRNVSAWTSSQVLKQNKLTIDNWTSDVFGNQYAVFKELNGKAVSDRQNVSGELWVRTNEQSVKPAHEALSNVFDLFKIKTFYADLTGSGILSIDCFFETLMIQTPTAVVFCPLEYDYSTSSITTLFDNCIVIDNLSPTSFKFETTWMFPKTKNVVVLCTELSGLTFIPNLYNLNLNDKSYSKIFPLRSDDLTNIRAGLSGIDVASIGRAAMHYNSLQQTYLITYKGLDTSGKTFFVDFKIEQFEDLILVGVDRFLDTSVFSPTMDPPEITDSSFFNTYSVTTAIPFNISLTAENFPTNWNIIGAPSFPITVDNAGNFAGTVFVPGTYYVNYTITNSGGSTSYPLTINAI